MMMMMMDQLRSVVARHWGRVADADPVHLGMVGWQRSLVLRGHCRVDWGVCRGVVADTRGRDDRGERSHTRRN